MRKPKIADRMNVFFCDCGCGVLNVELRNSKGKVIAVAMLSNQAAIEMAGNVLDDDPYANIAISVLDTGVLPN